MSSLSDNNFFWCVGIEDTFVPQTRPGYRALDEYELTQHYDWWREDFDLLPQLGVSHIRWGVPWYRVNPAPGVFEWGWIDEVMDTLVNKHKVQPIVDLMHYGTPLWLDNSFINTSYPQCVAEYAAAFAERYKDVVRYYTPLNEPTVNAEVCGRMGQWPPYLEGDDGYIKVLLQVARGMVLTAHAIREADADAVLVQVEALGKAWTEDQQLQDAVRDWQEHRYLGFDLFTGCFTEEYHLWGFLKQHGMTEHELRWFNERGVKPDVLGVNYYAISGGEFRRNAQHQPELKLGLQASDLMDTLRDAWKRYRIPMMLTETALVASVEDRLQWMDDTIAVVRKAIDEGIPVIGYTWWPLFDMVEWTYRIGDQPMQDYMLTSGLWSLEFQDSGRLMRLPNPLAQRFREYARGER